MGLSYPVANTATDALATSADALFSNKAAATREAGQRVSLTTKWLTPEAGAKEDLQKKVDAALTHGFVHVYEDKEGNPTFAVTFWMPISAEIAEQEDEAKAQERIARAEETTDDIYFTRPEKRRARFGMAIRKPRVKKADPRQMELFPAPGRPTPETLPSEKRKKGDTD